MKSNDGAALTLVGLSEIAEIAGVKPGAVSNWRKRHQDFPKPVAELRIGPIWIRPEVELWLKANGKRCSLAPKSS